MGKEKDARKILENPESQRLSQRDWLVSKEAARELSCSLIPAMSTQPPPFYILISQSSAGSAHSNAASLMHPTVQLHYVDDPPTALLPTTEHPNILIFEPSTSTPERSPSDPVLQSSSPPSATGNSMATITPSLHVELLPPAVHSLSPNLAVTSVRVAQPPAAAVAYATTQGRDPSIYIIDYAPLKHDET